MSTSDLAVETRCEMMLQGRLQTGGRLKQHEGCRPAHISQAPVRHALERLAPEGLGVIIPITARR